MDYTIRILSLKHEADVQALVEACSDFYQLIYQEAPRSDAGQRILLDHPPGRNTMHKLNVGLYDGEKLIAVIDLIQDYPEPKTWFLGLLMIDPAYRGQGLGQALVKTIEAFIADQGAVKHRLGVFKVNQKGLAFWLKMGYQVVVDDDVIVLEKAL